jgi:hypothetical protein
MFNTTPKMVRISSTLFAPERSHSTTGAGGIDEYGAVGIGNDEDASPNRVDYGSLQPFPLTPQLRSNWHSFAGVNYSPIGTTRA